MSESVLVPAGIVLILVGVALVLLGSASGEREAEAGGVVFIGPIPVVFGSSRRAVVAAAVLGLVVLGLLALSGRGWA